MKRTILILFLLIISFHGYGQNEGFIGVKGGINGSYLWGDGFKDPRRGIQLGLVFRYYFNEVFSMQYEATYSIEGYKDDDLTVGLNYINVPILFKYQPNKFSFYVGGQISLLLNAKSDSQMIPDDEILNYFHKGKASLAFGLTYEFINNFEVDFRYSNSIHNIYDKEYAGNIWYTSGLINVSLSYLIPYRMF